MQILEQALQSRILGQLILQLLYSGGGSNVLRYTNC